MFGFFKKNKSSKKKNDQEDLGPDISHLSDAKQQLFAQLKAKREEMGPEAIAKMQNAVKMEAMKKKMKADIDNGGNARDRLLDEIRFEMKSDR